MHFLRSKRKAEQPAPEYTGPIIFSNKPSGNAEDDLIGVDAHVSAIRNAVANNRIIGVLSDFGAGKSTLIERLRTEYNTGSQKLYKINLWGELMHRSSNTPKVNHSSVLNEHFPVDDYISFINQMPPDAIPSSVLEHMHDMQILSGLSVPICSKLLESGFGREYFSNIQQHYPEKPWSTSEADLFAQAAEDIYDATPKLFRIVRMQLCKQYAAAISRCKSAFSTPLPIITADEIAFLPLDSVLTLLPLNNLSASDIPHISSYFCKENRGYALTGKILDYILQLSDSNLRDDLFRHLDFSKLNYTKISATRKAACRSAFEDSYGLNTINGILEYMEHTRYLDKELETSLENNEDYNNRIYLVEDTQELKLLEHDEKNDRPARVIPMLTSETPVKKTMFDLTKGALRYHPSVIVPAEVRDETVYQAVTAGQSGHTIITSFHADSARDSYRRLVSLCHMAGTNQSDEILLEDCICAWPIIVFLKQLKDNSRKIMEIFEATGQKDGRVIGTSLYRFNIAETERNELGYVTKVHGKHERTGCISPQLYSKLRDNGAAETMLKHLFPDAQGEEDI